MPAHIFVVNELNYEICIKKGLVALPEASADSKNEASINDALLSRLAIIHEGDYVLFYVTAIKELRGIWRATGQPFYDTTKVWEDKAYPFRYRLESTEFNFEKPLRKNDILDLQNAGKIWTFALQRASGSNAMFSISNAECEIILQEYLKTNPFTLPRNIIFEPYPVKTNQILDRIHLTEEKQPRYEASLMTFFIVSLINGKFQELFGHYSDYLSYVPTSLGTEMDILLFFNNPREPKQTISYDLIEVKLDLFDGKALGQLIGYESWFIHKKVQGDINMVRVTAIAKRFAPDVIDYAQKRKLYEGKEIKLLQYSLTSGTDLSLERV
jgi:hypothetical protein